MYYPVFGILYLISLLPFFILYGLSDLFAFFLHRVFGYRKEIVMENLRIAFPGKEEEELKTIARQFYHNFCDTWIESIKLISISKKEFEKRIVSDASLFEQLQPGGKSIQLYMAHNFNWEYANIHMATKLSMPFLGVYQPIRNKVVDRLFIYLRKRMGTVLLPANDMRNAMLPWRNKQYVLGLIADQNPGRPDNSYWLKFFSRRAPFVKGPEKYARFNNCIVVFCFVEKIKRGYYRMKFELVTETPRDTKEGELTTLFVRYIENAIRRQPGIYLWSHRRWRHEWKEEYEKNTLE
jgi:KDO2-lipid IV(A) lauroyltransferase